jgi:glycosyltransferase involved in cell wall biosynthesis
VGNFYPHKNVQFLIQSFARSSSTRALVLAGPRDYFLQRILNTLTDEEKKRIIIKDKQTLGDLAALYKNAEALIHPSISEGFGLPVVEALQFGLPVIASQIPVFQELLGTSHYSFDPYREASLIQAIQKFESDSPKKINTLNSEFSFEQMTKKTVDLYIKNG